MQQSRVQIPGTRASSYEVLIGEGAIAKLPSLIDLNSFSKHFVLTDTIVADHWLASVQQVVPEAISILIEPGETHKNVEVLQYIWNALLGAKADRRSLLINLGGGVIGDMGGFAAATYMRGMSFVQMPTTLLSQVDASVGGKLAIDFGGGKNLIGTFAQPLAVLADVETLSTLPLAELRSGYAEVLKHGLIADRDYFDRCAATPIEDMSAAQLASVVAESVEIKSAIVARDEREAGERKMLNFGHTIGHAIESLSHEGMGERPLLHGEAVSLGMICEAMISVATGRAPERLLSEIDAALNTQQLPTRLRGVWDIEAIIDRVQIDKKNSAGTILWTLVTNKGSAEFDLEVPEITMRDSIASLFQGE